jgi:exportin-T
LASRFVSLLQGILDGAGGSTAATGAGLALRCAAAECLTEIVTKRMDAVPKLNLVQSMAIVPRCAAWAAGFPALAAGAAGVQAAEVGGQGRPGVGPNRAGGAAELSEGSEELMLKLARLLSCLAGEIMDALKKVENGGWLEVWLQRQRGPA